MIVVLAIIAMVWSSGAFAGSCPARRKVPELQFTADYGAVIYDYSHSSEEIGLISLRDGGSAAHSDHPLGLTVSAFTTDTRSQIDTVPAGGGWCAYPDVIGVRIGFPTHRVYVDRRYVEGSCQRQAVLDHENTHVRIARHALAMREGEIRRAVQNFLVDHPAYFVGDQEQARTVYLQQLKLLLDPLLAEVDRAALEGHAALDAPESLERTRRACSSW